MQQLKAYQKTSIQGGWSRIDLLLMLYDRALNAVEACEIAFEADDQVAFVKHELTTRKTIMAILAGLKPDESEVAFNIARLLHYVTFTFDQRNFAAAKKILGQIHEGFSQIEQEANELENQGVIEPLPESDQFESMA